MWRNKLIFIILISEFKVLMRRVRVIYNNCVNLGFTLLSQWSHVWKMINQRSERLKQRYLIGWESVYLTMDKNQSHQSPHPQRLQSKFICYNPTWIAICVQVYSSIIRYSSCVRTTFPQITTSSTPNRIMMKILFYWWP